MLKRTLYFGNPVYLHIKDKQLKVVEPEYHTEKASIPIEDIACIILDHPQLTFTYSIISELIDQNVAIVNCDKNHMPSGLMLPLNGNHVQSERFRMQIGASEPLKKLLWAQTIKAKIENQARLLRHYRFDDKKLIALIPQIKSGDTDNIEGRAASIYWKILFKNFNFTRDRYGVPPNSYLNYSYAILRAIVARALVGSGLLPTLGIFHRNKYNAYCLSDDIMEPYRPICDSIVYDLYITGQITSEVIPKDHKAQLISVINRDVFIDKKLSPMLVAVSRTTNSLYECFEGNRRKIIFPHVFV